MSNDNNCPYSEESLIVLVKFYPHVVVRKLYHFDSYQEEKKQSL